MKLKELLLLTSKQKYNGFFIRGNQDCGEYKSYWGNGQLCTHCSYLNGLKHGEYKEYHSNGNLIEYKLFDNGRLIKDYLK